jgi:ribosome assembly protein YihI (activator of Der GTPase)
MGEERCLQRVKKVTEEFAAHPILGSRTHQQRIDAIFGSEESRAAARKAKRDAEDATLRSGGMIVVDDATSTSNQNQIRNVRVGQGLKIHRVFVRPKFINNVPGFTVGNFGYCENARSDGFL